MRVEDTQDTIVQPHIHAVSITLLIRAVSGAGGSKILKSVGGAEIAVESDTGVRDKMEEKRAEG